MPDADKTILIQSLLDRAKRHWIGRKHAWLNSDTDNLWWSEHAAIEAAIAEVAGVSGDPAIRAIASEMAQNDPKAEELLAKLRALSPLTEAGTA